jgi:DNA-directed RNA polymerase subunit RPC12/RpoP
MEKGQRIRLKDKNATENWTLKANKFILSCSRCKKYNNILDHQLNYINCIYCGNPNYLKPV